MPRKSEISTKKTKTTDGYTDNIFDTTAIHANTTLTAGAMDFLVTGKWFGLKPPRRDGTEVAKEWYKGNGEIMLDVINDSNFGMEIHQFFNFWGAFGTTHLHVEEDEEDIIYCKSEDIGTYVCFENAKGLVNKVIVEKALTPAQLLEEYGEEGRLGNMPFPAALRKKAEAVDTHGEDTKMKVRRRV